MTVLLVTDLKDFKLHVDTNHSAVKVDSKEVNNNQQISFDEEIRKIECYR